MNAPSTIVVVESPYGPLAMTVDALRDASFLARTLDPRLNAGESNLQGDVGDTAQLVDATEAARQLGVKATWLLTRARERRLPHVRVGKFVRFDVDEVRRSLRREVLQQAP